MKSNSYTSIRKSVIVHTFFTNPYIQNHFKMNDFVTSFFSFFRMLVC